MWVNFVPIAIGRSSEVDDPSGLFHDLEMCDRLAHFVYGFYSRVIVENYIADGSTISIEVGGVYPLPNLLNIHLKDNKSSIRTLFKGCGSPHRVGTLALCRQITDGVK